MGVIAQLRAERFAALPPVLMRREVRDLRSGVYRKSRQHPSPGQTRVPWKHGGSPDAGVSPDQLERHGQLRLRVANGS